MGKGKYKVRIGRRGRIRGENIREKRMSKWKVILILI